MTVMTQTFSETLKTSFRSTGTYLNISVELFQELLSAMKYLQKIMVLPLTNPWAADS